MHPWGGGGIYYADVPIIITDTLLIPTWLNHNTTCTWEDAHVPENYMSILLLILSLRSKQFLVTLALSHLFQACHDPRQKDAIEDDDVRDVCIAP